MSLHVCPDRLTVVAENQVIAEHTRLFNRHHLRGATVYDWRHYLSVLQRKPGALRNGIPFAELPDGFKALQGILLKRVEGDREMADVLALVLLHEEQDVLAAVELALETGAPSKQMVMNLLSRLTEEAPIPPVEISAALVLQVEPLANVTRYDSLLVGGAHAS